LNYSRFNDNIRIVAGPEGSVTELIEYVIQKGKPQSHAAFVCSKIKTDEDLTSPHKFFQEVVLGSDEARLWLEIRLSIANKMQLLWKKFQRSPKIWLLTGIYQIKDATTSVISRNGTQRGVEVTIPIPEPTGLATILLQPGGNLKLGSGTVVSSRSQILGLKVWAAQWQQVEARFLLPGDWKDMDVVTNRLKLLDVMSLQVERGADNPQFAEVVLKQEDVEEPQESLEEEYWELFDREVQRVEEDFEE
jgi:hypothetical protein